MFTSASDQILQKLQRDGLLLKQDKNLPNVVSLLTNEVLKISWWSHPKARMIFSVLEEISEHPDVLISKLIGGKVTFVHRRLWPALLAVGRAKESWQIRGLAPEARRLFGKVEQGGQIRATGVQAKELELRLLVHSFQVHSETGRHEISLESWQHWAMRVGCRSTLTANEARREIEAAAIGIGATPRLLPWHRGFTKGKSSINSKPSDLPG